MIKNFYKREDGFVNELMPNLVANELFGSAVCNLNCSYCYIPKTEKMSAYHEKILAGFDGPEFVENLRLIYGDNLQHLALWGTEPTLILHKLEKNLDKFLEAFPKLTAFSFSTNFVAYTDRILSFMDALSKKNRKFNFTFQISIDGPAWETDKDRGESVVAKIINNIEILKEGIKKIDFTNLRFTLNYKATVSLDNMKLMNDNPELLEDWYNFSYQMQEKFNDMPNVFNKPGFSIPSLVVPGMYTKEDGKEFAKFLKNSRDLHAKIKKEKLMPNYHGITFSLFVMRLHNTLSYLNRTDEARTLTCSGFDTQSSVDLNGDMLPCHRLILFNDNDYVKNLLEETKYKEEWEVSGIHEGILKNLKKHFMPNVHYSSTKAFNKYAYVSSGVQNFLDFKVSQGVTLIKETADAGLIHEAYKNEETAKLLSFFLHTAMGCPVETYLNTGSWLLLMMSLIKLFGNGAFEETIDEYMEKSQLLGGFSYNE